MKQFISFIRKEFFHIFRDRRTMLILLGMPIVQIILFGFAITTEVKNVRVAVLDPSNDVVTRRIIDRMDASEYFTVIRRLHSPADMEALSEEGRLTWRLFSASVSRTSFIPARRACSLSPTPQTPIWRLCRQAMPQTSFPLPGRRCFRRECMPLPLYPSSSCCTIRR